MTAFLLVVADAWAVAAQGGTSGGDLAVVLGALVLALALAVRAGATGSRPRAATVVAVALLCGWLVLDGPVRVGPDLSSVRAPLLVLVAAVAGTVVGTLDRRGRDSLTSGLVLVGVVQAVVAVAQVAAGVLGESGTLTRGTGTLGSANGLGALLVATAVLARRPAPVRTGSVRTGSVRTGSVRTGTTAVLAAGVLATGSRAAVLLGCLLLAARAVATRGRTAWVLTGAGVLAAVALFWERASREAPEQRLHLWREALGRIASAPLTGLGPEPRAYTRTVPSARLTTDAHDEILQWTVDYGLVGLVLAGLVVAAVLRGRRLAALADRCSGLACAVLLAAGLSDFTLHVTALALGAALLGALALSGTVAGPPEDPLSAAGPPPGRPRGGRRAAPPGCGPPGPPSPARPRRASGWW